MYLVPEMFVIFPDLIVMLSASHSPSNVAPDDLQAAPIIAFAAVTTHELCAVLALLGATANPGVTAQHNSAGHQVRCAPASIGAEQQKPAIRHDPDATAYVESAPQQYKLPCAKRQPGTGARYRQPQVQRQRQEQKDSQQREDDAGQLYQSAQAGIREEVGEVFAR